MAIGMTPPRGVILDVGRGDMYECFRGIGSKVKVERFRGKCGKTIVANYSVLKEDEKKEAQFKIDWFKEIHGTLRKNNTSGIIIKEVCADITLVSEEECEAGGGTWRQSFEIPLRDGNEWEYVTPCAPEFFNRQMGIWVQRQKVALVDTWWLCGGGRLWPMLPRNWEGLCT